MAIAVQTDVSKEDATAGLHAVEEHFRRAAVEPVEWIALEELQHLIKIKRKGFWWWRLLFLKAPDTKEFNNTINEGMNYLEKGRHFKGISVKDSYENLEQAYNKFHKLLEDAEPAEMRSRLFAIFLALVMLSLGFFIKMLSGC
jgi:hypothetical protein